MTPYLRTSGRKPEAENRRRRASVAPDINHGPNDVMMQFEWKSGITQYMTSSGPSFIISDSPPLDRASRPCERMQAFGAPLVPDVNKRR